MSGLLNELVLRELSGKELLLEGDLLLRWEIKRVRNWLWSLNRSDSRRSDLLIWRNASENLSPRFFADFWATCEDPAEVFLLLRSDLGSCAGEGVACWGLQAVNVSHRHFENVRLLEFRAGSGIASVSFEEHALQLVQALVDSFSSSLLHQRLRSCSVDF